MSLHKSFAMPMSFLESFAMPIKDNYHRVRLMQIDTFDYEAVKRKVARDEHLPGPALNEGIENLKRYYAVALLDPLNLHAVSKEVDPFWHSHVLFTSQYQGFCQKIFGQFVHHQPLDPDDKRQVEFVTQLYGYTLDTYKKLFKEVDPKWWPKSSVRAFGPVCLHQEIQNPEIRAIALFPRHPDYAGRP